MQGALDNQNDGHAASWNSKPWRIAAWVTAGGLMLVPVTIYVFSGNFGWDAFDFLSMAVILSMGCLLFDFAARKAPNFPYLAGAAMALAASFGLVVVNGAVGLVGSEKDAHNMLFFLVVFIALFGSILAWGRAKDMMRTMFVATAAHALLSAVLLVRAGGVSDGDPKMEVIGLTLFAGIWLMSALLFRHSSGRQSVAS